MSRSYRKPIIKDKPRNYKRTSMYWRPIRRLWKSKIQGFRTEKCGFLSELHEGIEDLFKHPKTIINDYMYCDYIDRFTKKDPEYKKYKRK